jgi:hypothetical protein
MSEPKRDSAPADEGRLETPVRPQAWRQPNWGQGADEYVYYDADDKPLKNAEPLYDAATVRYMLEGAWCAGYYDAGYTHDSAYACKMAEQCADEFLGPNVRGKAPAVGGSP